jgi:hypothetical protein
MPIATWGSNFPLLTSISTASACIAMSFVHNLTADDPMIDRLADDTQFDCVFVHKLIPMLDPWLQCSPREIGRM